MLTELILSSPLLASVQPFAEPASAAPEYEVADLGPVRDGGAFCFDASGRIVGRDERALARAQQELERDFGAGFAVSDVERPWGCVGTWTRPSADCETADESVAFALGASGFRELRIATQQRSRALGVNREGVVVGEWLDWAHTPHGFVASATTVHDLDALLRPDLRWVIARALDVDDHGRILAIGGTDDEPRLVLLQPTPGSSNLTGPSRWPIPSGTQQPPLPDWGLGSVAPFTTWCGSWGFEDGTLSSWSCARGNHSMQPTANSCLTTPISVVTVGDDPRLSAVGVSLPRVPPGGDTRAVQIGDDVPGGLVMALRRTFSVTEPNLVFQWAFVFQDGHAANLAIQPYFAVTLRNTANAVVFSSWTPADSSTPGFVSAPPGLGYRPWSCETIDLTPFLGQTLTIEFQASDCALPGHWGYAYVDFPCNPPKVDAGPDITACAGSTVQLDAVDPDPSMLYVWSSLQGHVGFGPSVTVPVPNIPCVAIPFTLTVIDPLSGCSVSDDVSLHVAADFQLEVDVEYYCNRVVLTPRFLQSCPTPDTTYLWSTGDTTQQLELHPDWYYAAPFTVTVNNGCFTHQATGYAGDAPPLHLIAPNTLTPNGDGLNDRFLITQMGIPAGYKPTYDAFRWRFYVWDRWGQEVVVLDGQASSGDALANSSLPDWDGRAANGQLVQQDVYTYKLYLWDCDTGETLTPVNGEYAPSLTVIY